MSKRKKTPSEIECNVLKNSRRRCCICFGLNRDEKIQAAGQIAHLDRNPRNCNFDNLAFMCLEHHSLYDSKSKQSKGFQPEEIKKYREELYKKFSFWGEEDRPEHVLNFLASTITLDDMLNGAIKVAGEITLFTEDTVSQALTWPLFESIDSDLWYPVFYVLEYMQSWGWLTFEYEEIKDKNKKLSDLVRLKIKQKPICKKLAELLKERHTKRKEG